MADLKRIQKCIEQIAPFILEVEVMLGLADTEAIKNKLLIWKSETEVVLDQKSPNNTPELNVFRHRWNRPMVGSIRYCIIKILRNARTDLRLIPQLEQPVFKAVKEVRLRESAITDYAKICSI